MKITILEQEGNTLLYRIEREKGFYNNITEPITLIGTEGLTEDEIKTLGYIKLKPLAVRVFEAIEPLDEVDNPIGFKIIPSRTVKTEIIAPNEVFLNSVVNLTKHIFDQYGQITFENVPVDTKTVGPIIVEGKTINVVKMPQTTDDYMVDLDYRLSKIEMGV